MTNIITSKDIVIKPFKKFCDFLKKKRNTNSLPENYLDYTPTIIWGDISGARMYFTDKGIRYFCEFRFTLNTLMKKLHEAGITHCNIDTTSMISELYSNIDKSKIKRIYPSRYT
ncbi:MAG: hypothetical protein K2Y14_09170 [Burkholderiales bacterium]|nr:hypothetical protein [Burkholderiales bacterium]